MTMGHSSGGINFAKLNPPLHSGVSRIAFSPITKQMLDYFDDLTHEITGEFVRYLKKKFDNIEFIKPHLPSNFSIDYSTSLANALHHCFPILYGLQQRSENNYQRMFNFYLRSKVNDMERKHRDRICILLNVFQLLAESKQLLHIIARKADTLGNITLLEEQLTYIAKEEMQKQCQSLARVLDQCRVVVASPKEQNIFAGLISRCKGFAGFVEKKLKAYSLKVVEA